MTPDEATTEIVNLLSDEATLEEAMRAVSRIYVGLGRDAMKAFGRTACWNEFTYRYAPRLLNPQTPEDKEAARRWHAGDFSPPKPPPTPEEKARLVRLEREELPWPWKCQCACGCGNVASDASSYWCEPCAMASDGHKLADDVVR